MPTYDYICENCKYEFEQLQPITAGPLRKCPKCGKMSLKRLIGAGAGVIFKGTGFYQTDYRSQDYNRHKEKEKKGAAKKDTKTACKNKDVKAETKTKPKTKEKKKTA